MNVFLISRIFFFRMIKLAHLKAETPQDDIMDPDNPQWFPTSNTGAVRGFSAVCLLTARYFADVLGKDKVVKKVLSIHF